MGVVAMHKNKWQALAVFSIFLLMLTKVNGFLIEAPLLNKLIYLDPGHGGVDPGAQYKDIYEKTINLEIAQVIANSLIEKGAIVYLTRNDDYDLAVPNAYLRKRSDLYQRALMINRSNCDLYLSIHLNASVFSSWRGAQVFYSEVNSENKVLATIIQNHFKKELGSKRKIKSADDLYMYKKIEVPGVLLELGFISNPNDRYILRQPYYQKKIARLLTQALIEYFKKRINN